MYIYIYIYIYYVCVCVCVFAVAVSQNTKSLLDVWMEYYESQWKGQAEVSEIVKVRYF